jgi:magnesium-dependent phosphatase 1
MKTRRARVRVNKAAMADQVRLPPVTLGTRVPELIVFDLDDTVWFPELYMMCGAPWSKDELGRVTDVCGEELAVYPAAREALKMIHTYEAFEGTRVAVASRTNRAQWAREAMKLQVIAPGVTLQDVAGDLAEIYPGSKRKHLASLREKTGVPYHRMCFFDNEGINVEEVAQLGVTSVYCPGGMSQGAWEEGLRKYARRAEDTKG